MNGFPTTNLIYLKLNIDAIQDLRGDAINRITTNGRALEICAFLKSDQVRSGAIHCALRKSYNTTLR